MGDVHGPARGKQPARLRQPINMPRLTTTRPGLGYAHRAERKRQIAGLRDGTPCPRCGLAMLRGQLLDLDDFPGCMFGVFGLFHALMRAHDCCPPVQ